MKRGQRFAFLGIAAVIAVVAVIVLAGADGGDEPEGERSAATATPTATETPASQEQVEEETPTPEPTPEPPPLLTSAKVTKLEYNQGDTVRFRVRSSTPEHVHVHGYDLLADVEPGRTTRMSFQADITGIFEIEFENSGTPIAELRVNP